MFKVTLPFFEYSIRMKHSLIAKMCKVILPLFEYSIRMKHSLIAKDFGKKNILLISPKRHFHENETEVWNSRVTKSSYAKLRQSSSY